MTANDGYTLPDSVVVTVDGETLNADQYTYDSKSGALTVQGGAITGDIVIIRIIVRYAVKIWGICAGTYSYDDGATTGTASLTFGPATGADHLSSYVSCDSDTCIHKLSWDEIIDYCNQCQGDETMLTNLFGSCLENGCTKAVELTPNETLFNMETVSNYMGQGYEGDGVSTLYYLLNGTGGSSYTRGAIWNYSYDGCSANDLTNVYSRSRIRTTLTGDKSNIDEWLADNPGANDYYRYSTLCDESNCLLSCFPESLQEAVVPRTTFNSGNATGGSYQNVDTKTTYDKLFLFSIKETGASSNYDDGGGDNYGVNSYAGRIAYEFSGTNATTSAWQAWWSRSRFSSSNYYACVVSTNGAYSASNTVLSHHGLSPGFCIK